MTKDNASKKAAAKADDGLKKTATVEQLLMREGGTSLDELTYATGWQPHSCRAFLTGLRKKGWVINRQKRDDGTTIWAGRAPTEAAGQA